MNGAPVSAARIIRSIAISGRCRGPYTVKSRRLTTGTPKFIPITREFVTEYRRGWNLWGMRALADHRRLLGRKSLQICSDWHKSHTEGGIPCGSISGLAAEMAPWISRVIFLNLRQITKITDPLAKHYATLRLTLPQAPAPTSSALEKMYYPDVESVVAGSLRLLS